MKIALLMDQLAPGSALKLLAYPFKTIPSMGHQLDAIVIKETRTSDSQIDLMNIIPASKIIYLHDRFPKYIKVFDIKIPFLTFFGFYHLYSYFFAGAAVKKLNKEYDVVIAYCQYTSFAAKSIANTINCKYFVLAWDPSSYTLAKIYSKKFRGIIWFLRIIANLYDKIVFSGSSGVIISCNFHRRAFSSVATSKIHLLTPGCNLHSSPFASLRHRDLVTWDRWDYGNDPTKILFILKEMQNKKVKLSIGGFWHSEMLQKKFSEMVRALNLNDRVEMLGELSESEIVNICLTAKLHIHPIHEAFGMQVLEASSVGCPSIIVRGSGSAELYRHRVSGLHPADDISEFAQEIDWAFSNIDRLSDMGHAAYEVAKMNTWEEHSRKILRIISN